MSLNEMKLSEVQELITNVEHLIIQLGQIVQYTPSAERIVIRLERAKESFELSVQQGLNKIEKALFDLDYSKIQSDLAKVVRHQVMTIIQSMEKIQLHHKNLKEIHGQTDASIDATNALIDTLEEKIKRLSEQLNVIPEFNRRLAIGTGLAGFFAGMTVLYLLSYVTWLPKPYFSTNEQSILLGMVQNHTLRLDTTSLDSIGVRVDTDAFDTNNTNTGDKK